MLMCGLGLLVLAILAMDYKLSGEKKIEKLIRENEDAQVIIIEYRG